MFLSPLNITCGLVLVVTSIPSKKKNFFKIGQSSPTKSEVKSIPFLVWNHHLDDLRMEFTSGFIEKNHVISSSPLCYLNKWHAPLYSPFHPCHLHKEKKRKQVTPLGSGMWLGMLFPNQGFQSQTRMSWHFLVEILKTKPFICHNCILRRGFVRILR